MKKASPLETALMIALIWATRSRHVWERAVRNLASLALNTSRTRTSRR